MDGASTGKVERAELEEPAVRRPGPAGDLAVSGVARWRAHRVVDDRGPHLRGQSSPSRVRRTKAASICIVSARWVESAHEGAHTAALGGGTEGENGRLSVVNDGRNRLCLRSPRTCSATRSVRQGRR